jgi:hypothetical protein
LDANREDRVPLFTCGHPYWHTGRTDPILSQIESERRKIDPHPMIEKADVNNHICFLFEAKLLKS